jgi:hypothetical protein
MHSRNSSNSAARQYRRIVRALRNFDGVTTPDTNATARGFGASALKVHNKIFAMISSRGEFVVKLPRNRVEALVAAGVGERFDGGRGRPMKEWLAIRESAQREWLALAKEALFYTGSDRVS